LEYTEKVVFIKFLHQLPQGNDGLLGVHLLREFLQTIHLGFHPEMLGLKMHALSYDVDFGAVPSALEKGGESAFAFRTDSQKRETALPIVRVLVLQQFDGWTGQVQHDDGMVCS